jgi:hypothetical protein
MEPSIATDRVQAQPAGVPPWKNLLQDPQNQSDQAALSWVWLVFPGISVKQGCP